MTDSSFLGQEFNLRRRSTTGVYALDPHALVDVASLLVEQPGKLHPYQKAFLSHCEDLNLSSTYHCGGEVHLPHNERILEGLVVVVVDPHRLMEVQRDI